MFLLRLLLKTIKALNSETSSTSIAAAFALGTFAGFVPMVSLQTALVLLVVLAFRVNISTFLVSLGIGKALAVPLAGTFDSLGGSLLADESLRPLWTGITNNPALGSLGLGYSIVLGGTIAGLVALPACFLLGRAGIGLYRRKLEARLASSPAARTLGGLKLVGLYQRLTSPFA